MMGVLLQANRDRRGSALVLALVVYVATFAAYVAAANPEPEGKRAVVDLALLVGPAITMVACAITASRVGRTERAHWLVAGLSAAVWTSGQALLVYREVILQSGFTSVSFVDLSWYLSLILFLVSTVVLLISSRGPTALLGAVIDTNLIILASIGLGWELCFVPLFAASSTTTPAVASPLLFVLVDVVGVIAVGSVVWNRSIPVKPHSLLMLGSFICLLTGATINAIMLAPGTYHTLDLRDVFWPLGFALVSGAALARTREQPVNPRVTSGSAVAGIGPLHSLLPYIAIPAAGAILHLHSTQVHSQAHDDTSYVVVLALALLALAMTRQYLTFRHNLRLSESLADLSRDLEARVAEQTEELRRERSELARRTEELSTRTEQLAATNRVATRLGRCTSEADLLDTSLELVAEATGLSTGIIWLLQANGEIVLTRHRGLRMAESPAFLAKLPVILPALRGVIVGGEPRLAGLDDFADITFPAALAGHIPASALIAPLIARGNVLGAIAIYDNDGAICRPTDLDLAHAIGAELGITLENVRRYEEARHLADHDSLTGLLNHRAFHERFEQEMKRAERSGRELAVVMMDLDDFKLVNDTWGHPAGDRVLCRFAAALARNTRASDVIARYGGDEFVALLPETDLPGAHALLERIQTDPQRQPAESELEAAARVGLSFGVARYPVDGQTSNELVGIADSNLYAMKRRNAAGRADTSRQTLSDAHHESATGELARVR